MLLEKPSNYPQCNETDKYMKPERDTELQERHQSFCRSTTRKSDLSPTRGKTAKYIPMSGGNWSRISIQDETYPLATRKGNTTLLDCM